MDGKKYTRICKRCENEFVPKRKDSFFCSTSCADKYYRQKRIQRNIEQNLMCKYEDCTKHQYLSGLCKAHYSASKYKAKLAKQKNCLHCGTNFIDVTGKRKFCSIKCSNTYRARAKGVEPYPYIKEVICKNCKCTFKPRKTEFSTFCSRDCSIAYQTKHGKKSGNAWESQKTCAARRKRRMKANGFERINKTKVFERDKWICHICGCKTPKSKRGTIEMDAPEVDHIIPLAAGGSHTYSNVACACKRCNIKKSTKPLGQLNFGII